MTRRALRVRIAFLVFCSFCISALPARAQYLAYVANFADGTVSVIDTATATLVATIPVGSSPGAIAVTPNGAYVYVLNVSPLSSPDEGSVSVISTVTNAVVATIPVGRAPFGIAMAPNGLYAYVTNGGDGTISVIDTTSNTVTQTIPGGPVPCYAAFTQGGTQAYVSQCDSSPVRVINTATGAITTTISMPAPSGAEGPIVVSPDGATAYVPLFYGFVAAINTATNTLAATWSLNGGHAGIDLNYLVFTPDGATGYITAQAHNNVIVVPSAAGVASGVIPVGNQPGGLAITPDGTELYAANAGDGTISVIQVSTDTVIGTIAVGNQPAVVAFSTALAGPPPVCTVTDTSDDPSDTGSLRYCLNSTLSTVTFASNLNGQTISVNPANGPLTISANKTIQGPGPNLLTISGGNAVQVFAIPSGTVTISGLTIANGNATGSAGLGIGNGNSGGAINNNGALTLINTTIANNMAPSGGGGIFNNYPGATLTVINSTVSGNVTPGLGGGIDNYGRLTVSGSTFFGNVAGTGGGILDANAATVTNSTFSGNTARNGGPPIGGNTGTGGGGGIYVGSLFAGAGTLTVSNSTLSGNTAETGGGGGLAFAGQGTLSVLNDVIAGNTSVPLGDDCDGCGTPTSLNFISTPDNLLMPALALLGSYGGQTEAMIPLPGSPVICAGSPSLVPAGLSTDQRGFPRLNTSYPGYGGSSPCLDLGAVQTNYQSVQFDQAGYAGKVGHVVSPAPILSVTENGQNLAGIPVTLDFSGSGAVSGLGPVSTVAGIGATFGGLSVTTPGTDSLSVTFPVVGAFTLSANASLTITPVQTTPTVTWLSPAAMTYGTPLGATQLDATASVPGTFAYSPAAGTILAPGTSTLSVTFTPTDLTDYTTATASVSISVEYGVCLLYDQTKSVHSGAAYPVKLYLCDASGADVSAASIVLHATSIVGVSAFSGDVEDTGNANPDADFRFDSTLGPSGGYIFNLSTNGVPSGTYALQFTVGTDPTLHSATFGVK